jgi:hypothetical protein
MNFNDAFKVMLKTIPLTLCVVTGYYGYKRFHAPGLAVGSLIGLVSGVLTGKLILTLCKHLLYVQQLI